jgi:predicted ribosomally synthesized peptide with SipW-like signal peptide
MKINRKILISLLVLASFGGAGIAVTRAFFTDRETVTGSKFTVGTLDMAVGTENGTISQPFVVENIGASGNIADGKTWEIKNVGTLPGRLFFKFANVVNAENGCNEPEKIVDTTCEAANDPGEVGQTLKFSVKLDDEEVITGKTLSDADAATYGSVWNSLPNVVIAPGQSKQVGIEWVASESDYGNEIQSDSVAFDAAFNLVQMNAGTIPAF